MITWGNVVRSLARTFGTEIRDNETDEFLGKAILLAFRGRLLIIGYTGRKGLRPVPVIRREIRYWVQEMKFCAAEEPNYPRLRGDFEK